MTNIKGESMGVIQDMPQFFYDVSESPDDNFIRWFEMTNFKSFRIEGTEYTVEEGKKVFNSLFAVNLI
jgi:hypothetical protein|tara:strand:+ start:155 stop:358 length:204 start_codon:yes stop_codon:yes gene_type:complete